MDAAETQDPERLRRQLRALSAVNRQLHAQLEGPIVRVGDASGAANGTDGTRGVLVVRRLSPGSDWLEQLHLHGGGDATLVHTPTKGVHVIEGKMRRQVKAGILAPALIRVLGPPREMRDKDLTRWTEGPPVEVLEAGTGPAFVVVGGRRLPLRGLPLSYFVTTDEMLLFPQGEELVIAAHASLAGRAARARALLQHEGSVRGGAKLARKAVRRLLRSKPRPTT